MNEVQANKQREKILEKLKDHYLDWLKYYKTTDDRKKNAKLKEKREEIQKKADALTAELASLDEMFPPKTDYSKQPRYANTLFIPVPKRFRTQDTASASKIPAAHSVTAQTAASVPARPASTPVTPVTVTHSPSVATQVSRPASAGPHIPVGNYFSAHEQLISKIARTAAQRCARWIRSKDKEWKAINNGYSSEYYVDITVHKEGVCFNKLAYEGLNSIWFSGLGMSDLQQTKTDEFLRALKPFLDAYFPQEIEKAFSDVSPLIKRTTSVTYGEHDEGCDFDGRSILKKCIHVSMHYTFPPAPKLKSW